VIFLNKAMM